MSLLVKSRIARLGRMMFHFLTAQGCVQALNVFNGFLLLRVLARPEYAVYSLAVGFQLTLGGLTDIGLSGAIVALVGARGHSPSVVGGYVKAASTIRTWLVGGLVLAAVAVGPRLLRVSGLSKGTLILLLAAIISALYFQCWGSYYDAPLLIRGDLASYYRPQIIASIGRLILTLALWWIGWLGPVTAIWLMTGYYVALGVQYRVAVRSLIVVPRANVRIVTKEMIRYLLPLLPGVVYAALSGQLSIFIIGLFGTRYDTAGIAALARVTQLFILLNTANVIIVAPALARLPSYAVLKRYLSVLALAVFAACCILVFSRTFPRFIVFLLGSQYRDLIEYVPLSIGTSCLAYVCGTMWAMHAARRWIFWWGGSAQILVVIMIQILSAKFLGLGTIVGVLKMNMYIAVGSVAVQVAHALVGFSRYSRGPMERGRGMNARPAFDLNA